MKSLALLAAALVAMLLTSASGASESTDETLVRGAKGLDVVNAVVDKIRSKCVFPEDRLFLRRTAHVVSDDGNDPSTYRRGYDGGIWQIDEDIFQSTLSCSDTIDSACATIKSELNIDWTTAKWKDLRKPLYSGLAAALVTLKRLAEQDMSGDVASQAKLCATMYSDPSLEQKYLQEADDIGSTACSDDVDIAFILDSSSSVDADSFKLMLKFTANVVDLMGIGGDSNHVRVAEIVFSDNAKVEFDFDDHVDDAAALKDAILNTGKLYGLTATDEALDQATSLLFGTGGGSRDKVKKVAVLVTDGRSNRQKKTVKSAADLKDKGATVFAIGIGENPKKIELDQIASTPTCSHVFTLPSFAAIDSILTEIQKSVCEASFILSEKNPLVEGKGQPEETQSTITAEIPSPGKTIVSSTNCGILDTYVSTTDPKPSPAVYEEKYQATGSWPTALSVVDTLPRGSLLYITVVGRKLPANMAALENCTDYNWILEITDIPEAVCTVSGASRPCTRKDVIIGGLCSPGAR